MKARSYSSDWTSARKFLGSRASTTRPRCTFEPLAMQIVPPTATVSGSSTKGQTARSNASGSIRVSASVMQMIGVREALMPALTASALPPPFSLSTTSSLGTCGERVEPPDRRMRRRGLAQAAPTGLQFEPVDKLLQRIVGRAVIDHDHLERRIFEREHRLDAFHDRQPFIIGRRDDRDRRRDVGIAAPQQRRAGEGRPFEQGDAPRRRRQA